ncbi:bifunctional tryptophan synthase trp1 [Phlyctochytrium planicorne]|nr:bifunctional tryptophan synthase trp1 [Phlyctochytrium planicorne]
MFSYSFRLGWSSTSQRAGATSIRPFSWSVTEKPKIGSKTTIVTPSISSIETFPPISANVSSSAPEGGKHASYKDALLSQPKSFQNSTIRTLKRSAGIVHSLSSIARELPVLIFPQAKRFTNRRPLKSYRPSIFSSKTINVPVASAKVSNPIVDICRDRRRRITGLKKRLSQKFIPSLDEVNDYIEKKAGNLIPIYREVSADLLTPVSAYLKLTQAKTGNSFLFESVAGGERIGRYSFMGSSPRKVIKTGPSEGYEGDPLPLVEKELSAYKFVSVPGGAVGYISYDCVKYFEPKTSRELRDPLGIPDSIFMLCDTIVIFDHLHHLIKVVSHLYADEVMSSNMIGSEYTRATTRIEEVVALLSDENTPLPVQGPITTLGADAVSNVGKAGYESFVHKLKVHIKQGDIIQAVPSQRIQRKTSLHPFNAYRQLRSLNPSPYMFYVDLIDFQLVGASPEMLVKVEDRTVFTHPIAGTRKRGKTPEEDEALARDLLGDLKERSEHVMLVDLGRNDVNRICIPSTVSVDSLMHIERYSHVMHIVSHVSGTLRPGKTIYDAFRSIFPAGTVSGAPKVRAMQLIGELENEKRGAYAGAVGYFSFSGNLDTCISIRTMLFKDDHVFFQAGGGIVYDSNPVDEYEETVNKLGSNVRAIEMAEKYYHTLQQENSHIQEQFSSAAMTTILIDNYDSFTWNVYQYLSDLGADVVVYRNDELTVEACLALNPRNVVISPGPGHPRDAGISIPVIRAFAGKVPILGVCLGQQSMFELYGGTVKYAGEIVHGKTSPIRHDGKGLFENVSQGIEVTRYHSLAGDPSTLPDCLEITSWTDSGVVMGVRHKEFVMEGVQFHPESIASEEGLKLFANFLQWDGGLWSSLKKREDLIKIPNGSAVGTRKRTHPSTPGDGIPIAKMSKLNSTSRVENERTKLSANGSASSQGSILKIIEKRRILDVAALRTVPGTRDQDLLRSLALGLAPPQIDFIERIRLGMKGGDVAVMAEIKRASPSKGLIDLNAVSAIQGIEYAKGGAAVISVLTEPTWFKGSLSDLTNVRNAIDKIPDRPAVLRKDFVVDPYMIYEARLAGADTVLLIVAILPKEKLHSLIAVARSLNMEPLVEVATAEEMATAIAVGSRVIGVNNRDLHTFNVDPNRTVGLASMVSGDTILVALSGITGRPDVERYIKAGASAVLVGESLMRSNDKSSFIRGLRGLPHQSQEIMSYGERTGSGTLVKICGITKPEDAVAAAKAGASFLGLIFAKSPRQVDVARAKEIVDAVRGTSVLSSTSVRVSYPTMSDSNKSATSESSTAITSAWYRGCESCLRWTVTNSTAPLFVGVFQNHRFEEINHIVEAVGLDLVQLHGDEDPSLYSPLIRVPVIKAYHIFDGDGTVDVQKRIGVGSNHLIAALLDTGVKSSGVNQGGTGQVFDWKLAETLVKDSRIPVWVAGGLEPGNVAKAIKTVRPWCVDVSSGVEKAKGVKDHAKILEFMRAVKSQDFDELS